MRLDNVKRYFIITIDTEGDNLWATSDVKMPIETKNAAFLYRFQELCEKYGFVPTYLTNYEMAGTDAMKELGRDGLRRGTLEIGSHEHAWNTPPYFPLIKGWGKRGKPYLGEYPKHIIRKKLEYLTGYLEDAFQCPITSHRGGRWCLDGAIVRELERLGYVTDCTCTPDISWRNNPGWQLGSRGSDWSGYERRPFVWKTFDSGRIRRGSVMEIPVTIVKRSEQDTPKWFRPNGKNVREMLWVIDYLCEKNERYIEFMLHSSELMPGGSPTFAHKIQVERLYDDLESVFCALKQKGFCGISLSEFARKYGADDYYY